MTDFEELGAALHEVSDSYDDFVRGSLLLAKRYGVGDAILSFVRENPRADTSDIIERTSELIAR